MSHLIQVTSSHQKMSQTLSSTSKGPEPGSKSDQGQGGTRSARLVSY